MTERFLCTKSPDDSYALNNTVAVSPNDFPEAISQGKVHLNIRIPENPAASYYNFCAVADRKIHPGQMGFAGHQRKWCRLGLNNEIQATKLNPNRIPNASVINIELNFLKAADGNKHGETTFNSDQMAIKFNETFNSQIFNKNQPFVFQFEKINFSAQIKSIQAYDVSSSVSRTKNLRISDVSSKDENYGIVGSNTSLSFQASESSPLMLSGKSQNLAAKQNMIINPDFDFAQMGIGGLGEEFKEIFRRAFASRIFPPDIVAKMGGKHVKGILLHGPPGCGKTLMARKIGKMLSAREPQVVNGPEILNKFVGESEANIRKLFEPAEEEQKRLGKKSGLHIIIFDEIDAICKQRGASASSGSQVGDTVVNQLLSKIDGVDQLDNILIIGMTNRPDLIDDALMRPGRLEVKKEIQLPNEEGRREIFKIHTKKMRDNQMLANDVQIEELATVTKNFSGAEIEGLTRAAQSYAFTRHTKAGTKVEVNMETIEAIQVNRSDFQNALDKDIKPAFGAQEDIFAPYLTSGIKKWGPPVQMVMDDVRLLVDQAKNSKRTPFVTCLLQGVNGAGKTALAAQLAKDADFPFVKFCSPKDFIGYNESAKCNKIAKIFDDAHKSTLSCIIIDDLERLVEYNPIGPRFSNIIAQTLMVLLKKAPPAGKRLLVLATTSQKDVMQQMGLSAVFDHSFRVPVITETKYLISALQLLQSFDDRSMKEIIRELNNKMHCFVPIKKLIHEVGAKINFRFPGDALK